MLIIGEKINSSRKNIKEMVESKNKEFIQELARKQVEGGAQMLDLNIGTIRKNEPENMQWLVKIVQEAVNVPLCIDSPNHKAIKEGLKAVDIKKDIDREIMDELVKSVQKIKYGEVVIKIHNGRIVQIEKREKRRFDFDGGNRACGARELD